MSTTLMTTPEDLAEPVRGGDEAPYHTLLAERRRGVAREDRSADTVCADDGDVDPRGGSDWGPPADRGHPLVALTSHELNEVWTRLGHVHEVLTGYRSGTPLFAEAHEPRQGYEPRRSELARIRLKARELRVNERTVRRWIAHFEKDGPAGLLDCRRLKSGRRGDGRNCRGSK